jgi:hypothetical protein
VVVVVVVVVIASRSGSRNWKNNEQQCLLPAMIMDLYI